MCRTCVEPWFLCADAVRGATIPRRSRPAHPCRRSILAEQLAPQIEPRPPHRLRLFLVPAPLDTCVGQALGPQVSCALTLSVARPFRADHARPAHPCAGARSSPSSAQRETDRAPGHQIPIALPPSQRDCRHGRVGPLGIPIHGLRPQSMARRLAPIAPSLNIRVQALDPPGHGLGGAQNRRRRREAEGRVSTRQYISLFEASEVAAVPIRRCQSLGADGRREVRRQSVRR